jgi:biotin carboxylase
MNKAIWLFAGGPMQEITARSIKEMGYQLILTDKNKDCVCAPLADEIVPLDTFDMEGNVQQIPALKAKFDIHAVLTAAADCHYTVNVIAGQLNLVGIDPEISKICRNKHLTRKVLHEFGVLQPRSESHSDYGQAKEFVSRNNMKEFVVKATDNSGSRGFHAIRDTKDFTREVFDDAVQNGSTGLAIIEDLLIPIEDGVAELSVETIWYNGNMYFLNWVDRLFRNDLALFNFASLTSYEIPWGVELGHVNPSQHTVEVKDKIINEIKLAGKAIGYDKIKHPAILKADIMITNNGPVILELTPRLSGGWDSSLSSRLRGSDFVGGLIKTALGAPLDLDMWYNHFHFSDSDRKVVVLSVFNFKPKDCTGRSFTLGSDYSLQKAFNLAIENLNNNKFI